MHCLDARYRSSRATGDWRTPEVSPRHRLTQLAAACLAPRFTQPLCLLCAKLPECTSMHTRIADMRASQLPRDFPKILRICNLDPSPVLSLCLCLLFFNVKVSTGIPELSKRVELKGGHARGFTSRPLRFREKHFGTAFSRRLHSNAGISIEHTIGTGTIGT